MSAAAPWSVKGIDPKAREIAKDLARRSGLTLGDWLNRVIIEDAGDAGERDGAPPFAAEELARLRAAMDSLGDKVDAAERRSTLAIGGIDQTVLGLVSRLETAEREQVAISARFEGALEEVKDGQVRAAQRLAHAEETGAQPRSIEALRALETALGKVASHLYESETRTRESLSQMRSELVGLTEQVNRMSDSDAAPSQVMIDGVVSRIVQRLEEAETRTSSAVKGLETTVGELDERLKAAEARGEGPEARLEQLAQELTRNFDAARDDLAQKVDQATGARFQDVERSVREISGHVTAAERRSTQAMERMGREVLRVAEALGKRMEGVETRSAEAIEQVGGDVARIADVMETRLRRADQAQAESLERLGAEITRITERLAERVGAAERRSAQAIDDVGEQVSRVTDRINQRNERASADIAERIRQSEERTARLLDEAREKLDQRLSVTERRITEQVAHPPPQPIASAHDYGALFAEPDLPPGPFGQELRNTAFARRGGAPAGFVPLVESLPPEPERSPFEADDFDAAAMFEAFEAENAVAGDLSEDDVFEPAESAEVEVEALHEATPIAEPEPEREPAAKTSTRELIEQARAAARAAAQREADDSRRGVFGGFAAPRKSKSRGSKLKVGVMISAAAAALSVTTAGLTLYAAQRAPHPRRPGLPDGAQAQPAAAPADTGTIQAAVALAPQMGAAQPAAGADLQGLYADAVRRIEAKDKSGLPDLHKAANLGYAPAQFYLAKLYETGELGSPKDLAQARLWTERAAENGERKAMHNLALYYFEGMGGPKNLTAAAQWFHRAADLGLVDSQYNLAKLYEGGFGVVANPAEAYKWYLVAARSGDAESRTAAQRIKDQLSSDAQAAAVQAAQAFHPDATVIAAVQPAPAENATRVAAVQRALNRLGYYRGPSNGLASPALKLAVSSYQRDHNLPRTGALDADLMAKLASAG
jgi:localization factor PodJL